MEKIKLTDADAEMVLRMAKIEESELSVAAHRQIYTHLIVRQDADGNIVEAMTVETANGYYRNNDWTSIYRTGTSAPCNCDACMQGEDPDWDTGPESCDAVRETIDNGLDELRRAQ